MAENVMWLTLEVSSLFLCQTSIFNWGDFRSSHYADSGIRFGYCRQASTCDLGISWCNYHHPWPSVKVIHTHTVAGLLDNGFFFFFFFVLLVSLKSSFVLICQCGQIPFPLSSSWKQSPFLLLHTLYMNNKLNKL